MNNIKLFTYICGEILYNTIKENDELILEDGTILKVMYKYFNMKTMEYILYGKVVKEGTNNETNDNRNI